MVTNIENTLKSLAVQQTYSNSWLKFQLLTSCTYNYMFCNVQTLYMCILYCLASQLQFNSVPLLHMIRNGSLCAKASLFFFCLFVFLFCFLLFFFGGGGECLKFYDNCHSVPKGKPSAPKLCCAICLCCCVC